VSSSALDAFSDRVVDPAVLVHLLYTRGRLRAGLGQWEAAGEDIARLRHLADARGWVTAQGAALDLEARQAVAQGRHGPAAELADRAASLLTDAGESLMLGWVVETRGGALFNQGRYVESRDAYARAAEMARQQGDRYRDLLYRRSHAVATAALGDPVEAARQLQSLLASARSARLTLLEGMIQLGLASYHLDRRAHGLALGAAQRAFETHSRGGMRWVAANATLVLARVALDEGRLDDARGTLRDFLSTERAGNLRESARASLICDLAYCEALRGDGSAALGLLEPLQEGPRQVRGPIARAVLWGALGLVHLLCDEPELAARDLDELERLQPREILPGSAE
jgi:tetratricopeptide (TPR) repeat protein